MDFDVGGVTVRVEPKWPQGRDCRAERFEQLPLHMSVVAALYEMSPISVQLAGLGPRTSTSATEQEGDASTGEPLLATRVFVHVDSRLGICQSLVDMLQVLSTEGGHSEETRAAVTAATEATPTDLAAYRARLAEWAAGGEADEKRQAFVNVSGNPLTRLPRAPTLQRLEAHGSKLGEVDLSAFPNLTRANLNGSDLQILTRVPASLEVLEVRNNPSLQSMASLAPRALKELYAANCGLSRLPDMPRSGTLCRVAAQNNGITTLPDLRFANFVDALGSRRLSSSTSSAIRCREKRSRRRWQHSSACRKISARGWLFQLAGRPDSRLEPRERTEAPPASFNE